MKEITIYLADDGSRFNRKADAEKYEAVASRVAAAEMKYLGKRTKAVERGLACIEHDKDDVRAFRREICKIAADYIPDYKNLLLECGEGTRHISHAGRIISDYHAKALDCALFRLDCINEETGREYEQPYYATHPDAWEGRGAHKED